VSECPVPCNLCGASDIDVIGKRDREGRPLRTTICRQCGLVWSNPRPAGEDVRRYYSCEYRQDYKGRSTPSLRQIARSARGAVNRCRALAPYLKEGGRILDVGAGGGEVVYALRRFGFDASGIEPDQQYARHAREVLGVQVRTGFVQDVAFAPGSFEAITMYHALEHVADPLAILSRLRTWLVDEGLLLIEVPNVEARCIAPAHRFHFAHFYNFNARTLEALARKAGLTTVHMTTSEDGGNLNAVFKAAARSEPARIDPDNYARICSRLRRHSTLKYYLSRFPYTAPFGRLRAYLTDRRAAARGATPTEVLDALINAQLKLRPTVDRHVQSGGRAQL
jgi:2-polyprenyl-3-methyl-5-hydroxy-6-metoxy-1,4-benzoquinol methylase